MTSIDNNLLVFFFLLFCIGAKLCHLFFWLVLFSDNLFCLRTETCTFTVCFSISIRKSICRFPSSSAWKSRLEWMRAGMQGPFLTGGYWQLWLGQSLPADGCVLLCEPVEDWRSLGTAVQRSWRAKAGTLEPYSWFWSFASLNKWTKQLQTVPAGLNLFSLIIFSCFLLVYSGGAAVFWRCAALAVLGCAF